MNDKQKRRLEVISRIDDEIVEKNTEKRVRLMRSNKKKKWIISITSMAAALALIATTVILLVTMLGAQVPVYTGMTVSNVPGVTLSADSINGYLGNGRGSGKGFSGDVSDLHNGSGVSDFQKPITDALEVVGSGESLYYAAPGQEIYVTIHLSNPDAFEIQSFTLNGVKYANYMFEPGSDLENLILKVTVPADAEGRISYTVDAIKYIDGEDIKDVRMDGDKTVEVGISTSRQPTATVSREVIGFDAVSFKVATTDVLDLVGISGGSLQAVLYDDNTIVVTKALAATGEAEITFDGLVRNTRYSYAVVAHYDALDGKGYTAHVLYEKVFYTKNYVLFQNVAMDEDSISFGYLWDDLATDPTITSLKLYQGDAVVQTPQADATSIAGLENNTEYRLVATYMQSGELQSISLTFTTVKTADVTFYNNGSTDTQTLSVGTPLSPAVRDGFAFVGWFTVDGTQITAVPAEPVTVFAKWAEEADASALTYAVSGGKVTVTGLKSDIADLIIPAYIEGCPVTKVSGFSELVGLESVCLPETLTEIGDGAFTRCTALEKIVLPKSLKKSGFAAFDGCTALTRVAYTGSFVDWLGITFDSYETDGRSNPVSISKTLYIDGVDITDNPPAIPAGTTALGNWALAGFDGLAEVVIPDSVQTVGFGAFSGCDSMTSLTIPVAGVTLNGYVEWMKLLFITEFTVDVGQAYAIPAGLKTICLTGNMIDLPGGTFDGFTALETVVLPDTLQTIGVNAFNGCTALTTVNIPAGVTKIGDYAFLNTALTSIDLPNGLLEIGRFAFAKTKLTEIVLPESLQIIQKGAFAQCDSITTLTTPVLKVSFNNNFAYGGLQYLFESYDSIGGSFPCVVPDTLTTVHVIGNMTEFSVYDYDGPFYGFNALTTVTLPSTLQSIGDYAFNGCGALTTVNIPEGVTEIGANAFSGCTALTSVHFVETEGWWYTGDSTATSGTALLATDLENTATAATYLKGDYVNYRWKRS